MAPAVESFGPILLDGPLFLGVHLLRWTFALGGAYLIGAIPTAYLAVSWAKGQDIRALGDGNVGAGNAVQVLGVRAGLIIALVDIAKGAVCVLLGQLTLGLAEGGMAAGFAAVVGHVWPVYIRGRGGRGAAPAAGALMAALPLVAFYAVLPGLVVLYWTKSSSKALAVFYTPIPFLAFGLPVYSYLEVGYSVAILVTVGVCHLLGKRRGLMVRPDAG